MSSSLLHYNHPARTWVEALPLGNGRLGAMVFGDADHERIALNEATLWSGGPSDGNNPAARALLPQVREAVFAGRHSEAVALCKKMQGPYNQSYLPLGDLLLDFSPDENRRTPISNYHRQLDLDTAIARITYQLADGTAMTREVLTSAPDQIIALHLAADRPGALHFSARLTSQLRHTLSITDAATLTLSGRAPSHVEPDYRGDCPHAVVYEDGPNARGMRFVAHLHIENIDGRVFAQGDRLTVRGATTVILRLSAATSFKDFRHCPAQNGRDEVAASTQALAAARLLSWSELLTRHVQDHQNLFRRVRLDLVSAHPPSAAQPTDLRLVQAAAGQPDLGLEKLLFDFGRYLLIACSRPNGQPANLQGLWNASVRPPWSSNWTININTQMNYWAAEPGALPECHLPLLQFIGELAKNGRDTARINYGAKGWVSHHNADLWRQSAPVGDFGEGDPMWANWCLGAAWLCQHLWEHFAFSRDLSYLREHAWPLMRGAAEFALDWLVEDRAGYLVTAPSTSPELSFHSPEGGRGTVTFGSTMDLQIFRDLFDHCLEAAGLLATEDELTQRIRSARNRLLPMRIGARGNIQEWASDFIETDVHHRHVSHLFGLHPGAQITPDTPELFAAARRTLELRGDDGTGWSLAWKICFWARLLDGDRAHALVRALLRPVPSDLHAINYHGGGGVYPSLLAAHPPFQIDANFGYVAGVIELLLQSHQRDASGNPILHLLPALPAAWPDGSVTGLRGRGGFTLDLTWKFGKLSGLTVTSTRDQRATLRYSGRDTTLRFRSGEPLSLPVSRLESSQCLA